MITCGGMGIDGKTDEYATNPAPFSSRPDCSFTVKKRKKPPLHT
jgi:hypothetical protein